LLASALTCLAALGCSTSSGIVPVSGRVTLNGQPLSGASVSFQPVSPRENERPAASGSAGKTDADGHFTLRLIEPDRPGALVGKHTVVITTAAGAKNDGASSGGERVPKAWRDGSQRFEVSAGGTTAANFEMKGT
jgi:hypothetical protein